MHVGGYTPAGKARWTCRDKSRTNDSYCSSTTDPDGTLRSRAGHRSVAAPVFKRKIGRNVKRVIVTAAQNATPVHEGFMAALEAAAKFYKAELIVIPLRYKNPTSRWTKSQSNDEQWAKQVVPYLCNERKKLNPNLILLGDVKVQPTAMSPLDGFEAITHGESGILGHTKMQTRSIPRPQGRYPKLMTTTGACTVQNYTDSKAGKLGEFHHTLGAVIVELDGSRFFMRRINAEKKTGNFYDLDKYFTAGKVTTGHRAAGLILGDTHVGEHDPAVVRATFEKGGIVPFLRPEYIVYHDLHDGAACNPHSMGNPFAKITKMAQERLDVQAEVIAACQFVTSHTPKDSTAVIVPSNHDDFLRRWLINTDWRLNPGNAEFYLESALAMVKLSWSNEGERIQPFAYWARKLMPEAIVLDEDQSFQIEGVECGMHGDAGPNGARGTIKNLRRIGTKSIIGHTHSPGEDEGCMQVGTNAVLKQAYMHGPSSHMHADAVIYQNGKRTLLFIIDGEWRLE